MTDDDADEAMALLDEIWYQRDFDETNALLNGDQE